MKFSSYFSLSFYAFGCIQNFLLKYLPTKLMLHFRYFHGGALEEGGNSGSVYCIVTYRAADCHPGLPVATSGPFNTPQSVLEALEKIQ